MVRWRVIKTIAQKEITTHIDNPASYVAAIVFMLVWEFLFFRNAFLVGEASLRLLFDVLPWVLMFFAAAVTMGSFAQEKSDGTLELILTHPVTEAELVIGKMLSSTAFIAITLLFSLPIAVSFGFFSKFDWGAYVGQLIASIAIAGSFVSLGLYISVLLGNVIASLLATAAISFFFIMAGTDFFTANLPLFITPVFERLSLLSHVESMSRGVIDIRDVWYFVSFITVFGFFTYYRLLERKYGNRKDIIRPFRFVVLLFTGIAILTNVIGNRIPGRLDLSMGQVYSLSKSTKTVLAKLPDIVTITLYASGKLPSQLVPVVRSVRDTLADYKQYGGSNIVIVAKDPSGNPQIAQEAASRGAKEVQFNVIGQEEFQLKTGFLGIVVSYAGKNEVIPFVDSTGTLEYQLTSYIAKLTAKDKKTVTFLSSAGEKNPYSDYQVLTRELEKQYTVSTASLTDTSPDIASDTSVLVVAGPTEKLPDLTAKAIQKYLDSKKNAFFLLDTYTITPETLSAAPIANNPSEILKKYGVTVNQDLVYDLRSNETVRMGQGAVSFFVPYPFWARVPANTKNSPVVNAIEAVDFPWGSSLSVNSDTAKNIGVTVTELLKSTQFAGVQTGSIELSPEKANFVKKDLAERVMAVSIEGKNMSSSGGTGKIIVVGDSDFLTDQFTQNAPQNLAFGLSAISWLSEQEGLSGISVKQSNPRKLLFSSESEPLFVKYGNLMLAIIVPAGFGVMRLNRRRQLRRIPYTKSF